MCALFELRLSLLKKASRRSKCGKAGGPHIRCGCPIHARFLRMSGNGLALRWIHAEPPQALPD